MNPEGVEVPSEQTPYAVTEGSLRIGDDFFELDFSSAEAQIVREAIRWHDETPNMLAQPIGTIEGGYGWKGHTLKGDIPMLEMVVDALKEYENYAAGFGHDKVAYDARTALNHSELTVKNRLEDE